MCRQLSMKLIRMFIYSTSVTNTLLKYVNPHHFHVQIVAYFKEIIGEVGNFMQTSTCYKLPLAIVAMYNYIRMNRL